MKTKSIVRNLFLTCLGVVSTLVAGATANASVLTYDFQVDGFGLSQQLKSNTVGNTRYYLAGGTAHVSYNTVTDVLDLVLNTTGTIFGATLSNGAQIADHSNIIKSDVTGSLNISYTNVSQSSNPYQGQLLGKQSDASTSAGTMYISDIGVGNAAKPISYGVEAGFMDFTNPAFNDTTIFPYGNELKQINAIHGATNYFQFVSPSDGNILGFSTWLHNVGPVSTGCTCYVSAGGDLHGKGSEVPEPATVALLGMSLVGGAIRRRRAAKAA